MKSLRVSEARSQLYHLVDEAAQSHEPILLEGKRSRAVLVSEGDWRAVEETLYLLSSPGIRKSVRKGMKGSTKKCATELTW